MTTGLINRQRTGAGGIPAHTIACYVDSTREDVVRASDSRSELAGVTVDGASQISGVAEMRFIGLAEVMAGAEIGEGNLLVSDGNGQAIPYFGPVGEPAWVLGRARECADEGALCLVDLLLLPVYGADPNAEAAAA